MSQHPSTKAFFRITSKGIDTHHACTHTHIHMRRHTIRHALISCYACNKLIEIWGCVCPRRRPPRRRCCFRQSGDDQTASGTCLVSLLMWQSPELSAHWLTVWASDLTHLGPPWLGLLCLCVQTSAPMYCTVPDWAALACCRDERTHVPVMNGGVQRFGKLAAPSRHTHTHTQSEAMQVGRNHLRLAFSSYYATNSGKTAFFVPCVPLEYNRM